MSSTTRKGDGRNQYGLEPPKVNRVLSRTPVSKDDAFDMIARFLNREKQEYMSTAAGAGSSDETLVASTSAWNGLRRVCNSLLPSQEFNNSAGEMMGSKTREPVSAWWGDSPAMGQGGTTRPTSTTTTMPQTKMEPVSPEAADHESSSSSSGGLPDKDTRDNGIENKSDKKASKKEKKQAKKEAKKVKKAAKKLAKKGKKEKKDKIKVKKEV